MLRDISDVVKVQSGKSFEVVAKTAVTLRRFRFAKESRFLSGELTYSHIPLSQSCLNQVEGYEE